MQLNRIWEVLNSFSPLEEKEKWDEILRTIVITRVLVYVIQAITTALREKNIMCKIIPLMLLANYYKQESIEYLFCNVVLFG